MEWLIVAVLLLLAVFLNIRSCIGISEIKQQRQHIIEENEAIAQSMEDFVDKLEKKNDELYLKMFNYIKIKESGIEEKISALEEKLAGLSAVEQISVKLEEKEGNLRNSSLPVPEHEKISQLYKQGFSATQIAKVLQIDRGQVELAINLNSKKKSHQK
ncbi:hypothetical protein [Planococcus shixiaomingii]|uniref:hypothetical protein n=1 Tax=Planococcus shixiaomingii TaxID=3058393 RepID=UPI0026337703|nr:hypothetical protein [Planococcus sp. N022]WKA53896.1 hypothetical protein QWY21_14660 [Planococcus sp. N022]